MLDSEVEVNALGVMLKMLEAQGGKRRRGDTCLGGWVVESPGLYAKVRDGRAHHRRKVWAGHGRDCRK